MGGVGRGRVNTAADVRDMKSKCTKIQQNIITSHVAGCGEETKRSKVLKCTLLPLGGHHKKKQDSSTVGGDGSKRGKPKHMLHIYSSLQGTIAGDHIK